MWRSIPPVSPSLAHVDALVRCVCPPAALLLFAALRTEQLHLDKAARIDLQRAERDRHGDRADRSELDNDRLVALDEAVDEELVGACLELEMLERIDVH